MRKLKLVMIIGLLGLSFIAGLTNTVIAKDLWVKDNEQASLQPEALIYFPLQTNNSQIQPSEEGVSLQQDLETLMEQIDVIGYTNNQPLDIGNTEITDQTPPPKDAVLVSLGTGKMGWKEDHLAGDDVPATSPDNWLRYEIFTPKPLSLKGTLETTIEGKEIALKEDYRIKVAGIDDPLSSKYITPINQLSKEENDSKTNNIKDNIKRKENNTNKLSERSMRQRPKQTRQRPDLGSRSPAISLPERNLPQGQKPKLLK